MAESIDRFDLFDPHIQQAPHEWYDRLRRERGGVSYIPANDVYLVLSHDLVLHVLHRPDLFSSKYGSNREPPPDEIRDEIERIKGSGQPIVPTMLGCSVQ